MGAVSPVPFADDIFMTKVEDRIIKPTVKGLLDRGIEYRGFIFFGLINVGGDPMVIEYNVRMGDPETEVVIPRIKSDLLDLMRMAAEGCLGESSIEIDPRTATTVMLVSGGYPGHYEKGLPITGLDKVSETTPFQAGTALKDDGTSVTSGGRVMALTSFGDSIADALRGSYKAAEEVKFEGKYYRRDIGCDLMR